MLVYWSEPTTCFYLYYRYFYKALCLNSLFVVDDLKFVTFFDPFGQKFGKQKAKQAFHFFT